jgi:GxxExxY protein
VHQRPSANICGKPLNRDPRPPQTLPGPTRPHNGNYPQPFGNIPLALSTGNQPQMKAGYTQMHADEIWLNELSGRVIGCAFTVLNTLGAGFLEKVYENALAHELRKSGLEVAQQRAFAVTYDDIVVGQYYADLIIQQTLLVELKASATPDEIHQAKCLNYLKASGLPLCLLLNFGKPRLQIKRIANSI